jgi:hypothetical protein
MARTSPATTVVGAVAWYPPNKLRDTRIPLAGGVGAIPAVGFGTLIPYPAVIMQATRTALEVGFRHFDCAERYRNARRCERSEAIQRSCKPPWIASNPRFSQ